MFMKTSFDKLNTNKCASKITKSRVTSVSGWQRAEKYVTGLSARTHTHGREREKRALKKTRNEKVI